MIDVDRSKLPFRKNTEGYFLDKDGKILAQVSDKGHLIFPGGGVEKGETPEKSIVRETLEETGAVVVKPLKLIGKLDIVWEPEWIKTDKQKKRYNQFRGDEMYFFCGKIDHFEDNVNRVEDSWKGERLMPLKEAIACLEKGRPFSDYIKEYRETQLKILKNLKKDF